MGMLMVAESSKLSPRVQRGLPKTFVGRCLMTWFNPGPDTGYLFAISTGTVGALTMGFYAMTVQGGWGVGASPIVFAIACIGYLLSYLGLTRLFVMPLTQRFGPSFVVSLTTGVILLTLGLTVPFLLSMAVTGNPSQTYSLMQISNWAWTLAEATATGFDPAIAFLLLLIGSIITAVNLLLFLRAFKYHRVSTPDRVRQDQGVL